MLDNYHFNTADILLSACTLTGGPLVKRHWNVEASGCALWGHRLVACIEAVPGLGVIVALVEIIVYRCCFQKPRSGPIDPLPVHQQETKERVEADYKTPEDLNELPFHQLLLISYEQLEQLKIRVNGTSDLYTDHSIFDLYDYKGDSFLVYRRLQGSPKRTNPYVKFAFHPVEAEGIKVRTYALELLTRIEALNQDDDVKWATNVVKGFIEDGALERQASFEDFYHLLNLIKEKVPKTFHLERFEELLKLQSIKSEKERPWKRVRRMIRDGFITSDFQKTSEQARKLGIPAARIPDDGKAINLYGALDSINLLGKESRNAGSWLIQQMRVISFKELLSSVRASCESLHKAIYEWKNYYIFSIHGKSQTWMTDIAHRYLPSDKLPEGVLGIAYWNFGQELYQHLTKTDSDNFLFVDDGAYSGTQLKRFLGSLRESLIVAGKLETQKNIHFIYGFFPKKLLKDLQPVIDELKKFNVNVLILSKIEEGACSDKMAALSDVCRHKIKELAGKIDQPQISTVWKVPDFVSTALFLSEGFLQNKGRGKSGELLMQTAGYYGLLKPLNPIKSPYNQEFN